MKEQRLSALFILRSIRLLCVYYSSHFTLKIKDPYEEGHNIKDGTTKHRGGKKYSSVFVFK